MTENQLLIGVIERFVDTIEATGGIERDHKGYEVPHADPDWIDLGEAYIFACDVIGREPVRYDQQAFV